MNNHRTASRVLRPAAGGMSDSGRTARFRYVEMGGDWIRCRMLSADDTEETDLIYVAKAPLLRRSPFDNQIRDGKQYVFETDTRRMATHVEDPEKYQWETVIQPYVPAGGGYVGDVIFAKCGIRGGTGVTDPEGNAVQWLDCNHDGREFVRESDLEGES